MRGRFHRATLSGIRVLFCAIISTLCLEPCIEEKRRSNCFCQVYYNHHHDCCVSSPIQLHAPALTWLSSFTYGTSGLWLLIWLPYFPKQKFWSQLLNIPPNLSSVAIYIFLPLTQNETPRAFIQRICHFQDKPLSYLHVSATSIISLILQMILS